VRVLRVAVKNPPRRYAACVGLVQSGRWGAVKEVWNVGGARPTKWYYWPFPMSYFKWDRNGAYIGRRRKRA